MTRFRENIEFLGFRILMIPFSILPRFFCLAIGDALGSLIYHADRKHRQIAHANLRIAFGDRHSDAEIGKMAKASFRHFGRVFADIIKARYMKQDKILELLSIEGEENLKKAMLEDKGVLIFSAQIKP